MDTKQRTGNGWEQIFCCDKAVRPLADQVVDAVETAVDELGLRLSATEVERLATAVSQRIQSENTQ